MSKSLLANSVAILSRKELRRRAFHRARFLLSKPLRRRQVAQMSKRLYGPSFIPEGKPIVFCCFKNASYHLRAFIEHHQQLGFEYFVMMDNGSTDGSADMLKAYSGVTLYRSDAPFCTHQSEMREYLLNLYGRNRWCLQLDVDEHFRWLDYKNVSLSDFINTLERNRWTAVVAHMVDVFGHKPPSVHPRYSADSPSIDTLRARYPYFTGADLISRPYIFGTPLHRNTVSNPRIPCLYGGVRKSLFGTEDFLTKHPFFFYGGSVKPVFTSAHTICGASIADFSAILLHYKLVDNFHSVVHCGLSSGSHIDVFANYSTFLNSLESNAISYDSIPKESAEDDAAIIRAGFFHSPPIRHPVTISVPCPAV